MITARDYEKFSMDDRAVIADDFFQFHCWVEVKIMDMTSRK